MKIYPALTKDLKKGIRKFAVLIDPDKQTSRSLETIAQLSVKAGVDYFFFGGSLLTRDLQDEIISLLRKSTDIPVLLFPGNNLQVNGKADGILFLSLISGRNPELLIGRHVIAAPYLKTTRLEVIPTGYLLIDGGRITTVSYMSNTTPIPADKTDIAVCTALAGELLGLRMIYLDAGSGALNHVPAAMVRKVREQISVPLIVGGGIDTPAKARSISRAGADIVVVGNALERNPDLVLRISDAIHR
jgi:phosphoglycerol geranylgeranyltransferase